MSLCKGTIWAIYHSYGITPVLLGKLIICESGPAVSGVISLSIPARNSLIPVDFYVWVSLVCIQWRFWHHFVRFWANRSRCFPNKFLKSKCFFFKCSCNRWEKLAERICFSFVAFRWNTIFGFFY